MIKTILTFFILLISFNVSADTLTAMKVRYVSDILRHDFAEYRIDRALLTEITNSVVAASDKYDIPVEPMLVLMANESGFRPTVTSSVGAYGLMQINPPAWPELVKTYDIKTVRGNIFAGAHVLRRYYTRCSENIECTVRAYNVGIGNQLRGRAVTAGNKYWQSYVTTYNEVVGERVNSF